MKTRILSVFICVHLWFLPLQAQLKLPVAPAPADTYPGQDRDLALAKRFAPVFQQRLTKEQAAWRFDAITNFDFDGDWIGNNNWEHAADPKFPMLGYVYYSVIETESHYFITYTVFHARDWSMLQPYIQEGMDKVQQSGRYSPWLPPELRDHIEVNHENDLEGAQVIVARSTSGTSSELRIVAVDTVAHNRFEPIPASELELDGEHPVLYVESQKHGIHKFPHPAGRLDYLFDVPDGPIRVYRFKGVAKNPEKNPEKDAEKTQGDVGYDLLPVYSTFWKRAQNAHSPDLTFGAVFDFAESFCKVLHCRFSKIGIALRGDVAGRNRAMLPWGWFSVNEPELSNGVWFLDPIRLLRLHYPEERTPQRYLSNPFLGVFRAGN